MSETVLRSPSLQSCKRGGDLPVHARFMFEIVPDFDSVDNDKN